MCTGNGSFLLEVGELDGVGGRWLLEAMSELQLFELFIKVFVLFLLVIDVFVFELDLLF